MSIFRCVGNLLAHNCTENFTKLECYLVRNQLINQSTIIIIKTDDVMDRLVDLIHVSRLQN